MIALVMPPAFVIWIQNDSRLGLQSSNIDIHPWNGRRRRRRRKIRSRRRRRGRRKRRRRRVRRRRRGSRRSRKRAAVAVEEMICVTIGW